jgi:hypothetical protein
MSIIMTQNSPSGYGLYFIDDQLGNSQHENAWLLPGVLEGEYRYFPDSIWVDLLPV